MSKTWNSKTRKQIYDKFNGHCAYCGDIFHNNFTIDHIQPLRRDLNNEELLKYGIERGNNDAENYNPCCSSCNSLKSTHNIEQFRKVVGSRINVLNQTSSEYRAAKRFGLIKETNHAVIFYFEKQGGVL
jgi:5-methylcytosine-specific restriction endonuclease McrA